MEKHYYDVASLEQVLRGFERGYDLSSETFFAAHVSDDPSIAHVPGSHRQAWAGFYRTWKRMSHTGFSERVERELELA